jgi:hypothetical protein
MGGGRNLSPAWDGYIKTQTPAGDDRSHVQAFCKSCVTIWVREVVDEQRDEWGNPRFTEGEALKHGASLFVSASRMCT